MLNQRESNYEHHKLRCSVPSDYVSCHPGPNSDVT